MLLIVLAIVGTPAAALTVLCVGSACDASDAMAREPVPFCGLSATLRRHIGAGFREGRSPDVMAATSSPDTRVPVAFFGRGVDRTPMPPGVRLDSIAPTLEVIAGLRREHPEVRTGEPIAGITRVTAAGTPLIVMIAWKGVGTSDLELQPRSWPFLRRVMQRGAGSIEATTGSMPLDPSATLTTIGSGALPSSHGITGTLIREDDGDVSRAWSTPEAGSVIATFADDLDRATNERARIAAIVTAPVDRGLVGDGWYLDAARDDTVVEARATSLDPSSRAGRVAMSMGLGADAITDVLGIVLSGPIAQVDRETVEVVATMRGLVPDATFVLAGTGPTSDATIGGPGLSSRIGSWLGAPVAEAIAEDGLFLDRDVMVERSITADRVADAMRRERSVAGGPLFLDVYPSFAVAFARYC